MTTARSKISDIPVVSEAQLIYESPDGGKTVYAREIGSDIRYLVKGAAEQLYRQQYTKRVTRLMKILQRVKDDPTLKDALEQLEALYILKYGDNENN